LSPTNIDVHELIGCDLDKYLYRGLDEHFVLQHGRAALRKVIGIRIEESLELFDVIDEL
jgi:hypothetical protein